MSFKCRLGVRHADRNGKAHIDRNADDDDRYGDDGCDSASHLLHRQQRLEVAREPLRERDDHGAGGGFRQGA